MMQLFHAAPWQHAVHTKRSPVMARHQLRCRLVPHLAPIYAVAVQQRSNARRQPGKRGPGRRRSNDDASENSRPQRSALRWTELVERQRARDPASPRLAALEQLLRIEFDGAYVGMVGGSPGTTGDALSGRDARFVTELVAGVTRMHRQLDYILASLLRGGRPDALDVPVLVVMRIGLYELLHMSTPPHALNEHVQVVKQVVRPAAANLVNGVLRSAARAIDADTLPLPPPPSASASPPEAAEALAVLHSHPTWLMQLLVQQYGVQGAAKLAESNNRRPAHGVRVNGDAAKAAAWLSTTLGVEASCSTLLPTSFVRVQSNMQALLGSEWMRSGGGQVQDESAGLVVAMLNPLPGQAVLDACAAPGGKTMYAAARMNNTGVVVAADINAARVKALARMAHRQGMLGTLRLCVGDMAAVEAVPGAAEDPRHAPQTVRAPDVAAMRFDAVLVDVPCSGSGVLAKRADLRWRRTSAQMDELLELQGRLLDAMAPLVAPGGVLVYSTCSVLAAENEQQVDAFLGRHPEFEVAAPPESVPGEVLTPRGFMATLPYVHGTDGAFAARLVKKL